METAAEIGSTSWLILGQMAPYLLFGFVVAGLLSVCISPAWVERHLGGRGPGPVWKASLFGVPLPLCSCGVVPVAASIHRHGASRAATTAFLLSTPQTGVDSIAVTLPLLGPVFAIFRPIAALLTGLLGGALVQLFDRSGRADSASQSKPPACAEACCSETGPRNVVLRSLHYGFMTLPRDIGTALLLGVVIAGALVVLVPEDQLQTYVGSGVLSILLMMALGVPVYVCATASVPIAAGLIHAGASPGAALAFLIAGPATNAAAFTMIWKLLGRRTAVLYLITVAVSAVVCGLVLDWLVLAVEAVMPPLGSHVHQAHAAGWLTHVWAIALLAVMVFSSKTMARLKGHTEHGPQETADAGNVPSRRHLEFLVAGMTCSHCAESIRRALNECDGVDSAEVDLAGGRAVVTGEHLDPPQLVAVVTELGYSAKMPD